MLRSSSVFPSSAAKCKSEKQTGQSCCSSHGTVGAVGSLNVTAPNAVTHFARRWFYWQVWGWMCAYGMYRIWPLLSCWAAGEGEARPGTSAALSCKDLVPGWRVTLLHCTYTLHRQDQTPGVAVAAAQHLHPPSPRPAGLRGSASLRMRVRVGKALRGSVNYIIISNEGSALPSLPCQPPSITR